jgi:hypothetical protein
MKIPEYSFCEHALATAFSPWHIRKLTDEGQKCGGGADTLALCGREVCWDLAVTIYDHHLVRNCCKTCRDVYINLTCKKG